MELFNEVPNIIFRRVKKRNFSCMVSNVGNAIVWDLDLIVGRHFTVFNPLKSGWQGHQFRRIELHFGE